MKRKIDGVLEVISGYTGGHEENPSYSEEQRQLAKQSRREPDHSGKFEKPVVTEILPFSRFYPAESYHQGYHKKNPVRYRYYRLASGRDQFLKNAWRDSVEGTKRNSADKVSSRLSDDALRRDF